MGFDLPEEWFERYFEARNQEREFLGYSENPTVTDRYRLKQLLSTVQKQLDECENHLRDFEEGKQQRSDSSGLRERTIASFEALLFWFRMLEKGLEHYIRKQTIETEFSPRVRIIRRKIRILAGKTSPGIQ